MTLIGIPLSIYKEELHHIPKGILPTRTILRFEERLLPYADELADISRGYEQFDPAVQCHALPDKFYETCTFEELAKIWATHFIMLPKCVNQLFEDEGSLPHCVVNRLRFSLHRWGYGDSAMEWNALVDTHEGIRRFSFGLPDFEVRLAYPHYANWSRGASLQDRDVFLDGALAFFVHYRGEHVMTIGFSLARGGNLLLSQVQMRNPKGNRFLYKLPVGVVEYVVSLMRKYFPRQRLCLVDGASLTKRYISGHQSNIDEMRRNREPDLALIKKNEDKLVRLRGELGAHIRNAYRPISGDGWKVSKHHPVTVNRIRFRRIVRA